MNPSIPRIVLVDDQAFFHTTLQAQLGSQFQLTSFQDSKAALAAFSEGLTCDIILLDMVMPGLNGIELSAELRRLDRLNFVPIVLVSSLDDEDSKIKALETGADEFLCKTNQKNIIEAKIHAMLRLKRLHDRQAELMRVRDDLVNMTVHDMRTPLCVIRGYTGMLLEHAPNDECKSLLEAIQQSADRLSAFTNEILHVARMEEGRMLIKPSKVALLTLLQQVVAAHKILGQGSAVGIRMVAPCQEVFLRADEDLLARCLDNLLGNAVKFSPRNGSVTVSMSLDGRDHVRIVVDDEGSGVPTEVRESIFERYMVAPLRKRGVRQFGLGLPFCRLVAKAHGGNVVIEDKEGPGARFVLTIPSHIKL